ncbi:MAG: ATP-binding protein [Candidatus Omnitrophota bacterium]
MITRIMSETLISLAKSYPVITITGPRQSGKTTLAKSIFKNKPYCNLENVDERAFAINDPRAFLKKFPKGAILDEIQRAPDLLSYIQTIVDKNPSSGMFILTGSQNLNLLANITQSLAGRTAIFKLLPFTLKEITGYRKSFSTNDYLLNGFFPAVYEKKLNPTIFYRNYYETYIERDLRQLITIKDLNLFQIFIRLCAGRIGQLFNANSLANEVGVSSASIKSWMSILEASFIVFSVQPYHENIAKRVVKSRKIYFYDVGLASYLLQIENTNQLATHPLRGGLFENLVISELVKSRYNQALDHNLYFYRDSNHNEIDVLFKHGNTLTPIEIKSALTFNNEFLKNLTFMQKLIPDRTGKGFLIYGGNIEQNIHENSIINYKNAENALLSE